MPSRAILVFGRTGQVGWELRHTLACLGSVIALDYPEVDLADASSIRAVIRAIAPTVIVNAAAYTDVDKAEKEPGLAMAVNGQAPGVMAEEAERNHSVFVHYSTDYVFDGRKPDAYFETDVPNPLNVYGRTKLAGDRAVQAVGQKYLILRTSWVYGPRGRNFLLTMLRLARELSELRVVNDQIGAPTPSTQIAQATAAILSQALAPLGSGLDGRSGVYNLTSSGETSWYGFANALLREAAADKNTALRSLVAIPSSEYPLPAIRPANSRLSGLKVEQTFGVRLPPWEMGLSMVMETIALRNGSSPELPAGGYAALARASS